MPFQGEACLAILTLQLFTPSSFWGGWRGLVLSDTLEGGALLGSALANISLESLQGRGGQGQTPQGQTPQGQTAWCQGPGVHEKSASSVNWGELLPFSRRTKPWSALPTSFPAPSPCVPMGKAQRRISALHQPSPGVPFKTWDLQETAVFTSEPTSEPTSHTLLAPSLP